MGIYYVSKKCLHVCITKFPLFLHNYPKCVPLAPQD